MFKFWEISDNISDTVQDRDSDIVVMKDYYRNSYYGPSNGTIRYDCDVFTCAQKVTGSPLSMSARHKKTKKGRNYTKKTKTG